MLGSNGGLIGKKRAASADGSQPGSWDLDEQLSRERDSFWPKPNTQYIAIASSGSPFVGIYPFDSTAGFGAKAADPTTLPTNGCHDVSIHPSGLAVVFTMADSPFISAYKVSRTQLGAKYADPSTISSGTQGESVKFSNTGNSVVLTTNNAALRAYSFSLDTGFGASFSTATVTGTGITALPSVAFSPANDYILIGVRAGASSTQRVRIYSWSESTGFGTQTGATLTSAQAVDISQRVAWSPSGNDVVIGYASTPFIHAYSVASGVFGTKYANPTVLPSASVTGVSFTNNGTHVIGTSNSTTVPGNLFAYSFGSGTGFGTRTTPSTNPAPAQGRDLAISKNDNFIVRGSNVSPYIEAWQWSAGFGSKYSNPSTLPTGVVEGVAIYTP